MSVARRRYAAILCVLTIALASAACSSSSSSTSTGQASSQALKIGFMCSCSGLYGSESLILEKVFTAWTKTVNGDGGISGHQVQVTYENDQGVPGDAVVAIQRLISDHVDAIVSASLVSETWAAAVQQAGIPVVGMQNNSDPTFEQYSDFYPVGQTFSNQMYSLLAEAKLGGATNVGEVYCITVSACEATVNLVQAAGKELGVPLVYKAAISDTAPSYAAQCIAAKQAGATALYVASAESVLKSVAYDCSLQGYNPVYPWALTATGTGEFSFPGVTKGLWMESANYPYFGNIPAIQALNAAMDKYYPGARKNPVQWDETAVSTWASGLLIEDAVKAAGIPASAAPTAAEVVKGLESLHGDTLQGLAPPLTFAAGKLHVVNCWFETRALNGVPEILNNGKPSCVP